jgi:hypothetical protein
MKPIGHRTDYDRGYKDGASFAFGIIAMAQAIRDNPHTPLVVRREYWETDPTKYDCWCPGCGAYMKGRTAGKDEGTDYEWCGVCRP